MELKSIFIQEKSKNISVSIL